MRERPQVDDDTSSTRPSRRRYYRRRRRLASSLWIVFVQTVIIHSGPFYSCDRIYLFFLFTPPLSPLRRLSYTLLLLFYVYTYTHTNPRTLYHCTPLRFSYFILIYIYLYARTLLFFYTLLSSARRFFSFYSYSFVVVVVFSYSFSSPFSNITRVRVHR